VFYSLQWNSFLTAVTGLCEANPTVDTQGGCGQHSDCAVQETPFMMSLDLYSVKPASLYKLSMQVGQCMIPGARPWQYPAPLLTLVLGQVCKISMPQFLLFQGE
jgi:hypothetical protein